MRTIDEFVKHIKNGENSFIITLTCKHITKIMYGKKELYVQKEK